MNYRIEKDTVQETLMIPLFARAKCSKIYPNLYYDETAVSLIHKVDYDFSKLEKKSRNLMQRFGFLEVAMRQDDIVVEIKEYLKKHPNASIVNLGCGLDDLAKACDNGKCKIYNLDFKNVIEVRNKLIPVREREKNIACDLNDSSWHKEIDASNGVIFFATGVFYYFLEEQVKTIVCSLVNAFPGCEILFDAANRLALKIMLKTWIKDAEIQDVGAYFSIGDAEKEIGSWDKNIQVSSRGYMLGYHDLKDPSVSSFFRFLAKIADEKMQMQIVKIVSLKNSE